MSEQSDREGVESLGRPFLSVAVLAIADIVATLARGARLFQRDEALLYCVTAVAVILAIALSVLAVGSIAYRSLPRLSPSTRIGAITLLSLAPIFGVAIEALTAGRRFRGLPMRPALAVLAGIAVAAAVAWLAASISRLGREGTRGLRAMSAMLAFAGAMLAVCLDAVLLRRLYPAFHDLLAVIAMWLAFAGSAIVPLPRFPRTIVGAALIAVAGVAAAPLLLMELSRNANATFVVLDCSPLLGKALLAVTGSRAEPAPPPVPAHRRRSVAHEAGIDLRGRDVLLITIDALRADRLTLIGGRRSVAPQLDALALEGTLFRRAYTTTPHTSYSLASLLCGKPMREVLELEAVAGMRAQQHATLADLLERNGYRTFAFFPPAVFFVHEERFAQFRARSFGFDRATIDYAPASTRVEQLAQVLHETSPRRPIFAWVHLLEPHEPYEPPEEFARGDSIVERYDGEVAAADDAVGRMVAAFRSARPYGVVVVTADHGEELGDHGGYYHGTTLFDDQVRVPLLFWAPDAILPRLRGEPVDLTDVATTLLAALGIPRDARMSGDDLGALLRGVPQPAPELAFTSIDRARMVTDGRVKAICELGAPSCRLYDLARDPGERVNVADEYAEDVVRLRSALSHFFADVALRERTSSAEPDALLRLALGDPTVAPDLVPLLGDERADVRARAALALAELRHSPALPTLSRLRLEDPSVDARDAASVAALELGESEAAGGVEAVLRRRRDENGDERLRRRAALALAVATPPSAAGEPELLALISDRTAAERDRFAAIAAVEALAIRAAAPALIALLEDVTMRAAAAKALGAVGDATAADALVAALENERYASAQAAEAEALVRLRDRRAPELIRGLLGNATPLEEGVRLLLEAGALRRESGEGADLRAARRVRQGLFDCDDTGCAPGASAAIALPASRALEPPLRVVLRVVAGAAGALTVLDQPRPVTAGGHEIAFDLHEPLPASIPVRATSGIRIVAIVVVPLRS